MLKKMKGGKRMAKIKIIKPDFEPEVKIINAEEQLWRHEKESAENRLKQMGDVIIVTKAFIELATQKMKEAENGRK